MFEVLWELKGCMFSSHNTHVSPSANYNWPNLAEVSLELEVFLFVSHLLFIIETVETEL